MSRDFDNIKDINDGKEIWKLAVRLEDLWKSGIGKNEHMEFLILDKQGDNIQVLLPADLCPLLGPKLHEGSTYVMKNFKVQPNDFSVKFCDHAFKLVLVGGLEPVILILKHGKIKEPQGVYDLTISNAWNGTKLIMDQ
ncbi:hypothetical protein P8452_52866 [Trifolium repens]|nr:hypothetical protein P8452_52866 [Trifolium repens]